MGAQAEGGGGAVPPLAGRAGRGAPAGKEVVPAQGSRVAAGAHPAEPRRITLKNLHFSPLFSLGHLERYAQAREIYQEALKQAELKRDEVSIQHIREELAELSRKSRPLT